MYDEHQPARWHPAGGWTTDHQPPAATSPAHVTGGDSATDWYTPTTADQGMLARRHTAAPSAATTPFTAAAPTSSADTSTSPAASTAFAQICKRLLTPSFLVRVALSFLSVCVLLTPLLFVRDEWTLVRTRPDLAAIFCSSPPHVSESVQDLLPPWQPRCVSCPTHGTCRRGLLTCPDGYLQMHHECIPPTITHAPAARDMKERLISELEAHAGRRVCGDTHTVGAPSADLTSRELAEYVRLFQPTSEQSQAHERTWSLASAWLEREGVLLQNYRSDDPLVRIVVINMDSKQPVRFRAVYPARGFTCRLTNTASRHAVSILVAAALLTILGLVVVGILFVTRVVRQSGGITRRVCDKLQEDLFVDYDDGAEVHYTHGIHSSVGRGGGGGTSARLKHQAHSLAHLRAEFMDVLPASASSHERLLDDLVWLRVQRLLASDKRVEKGHHAFQFGLDASWRWVGSDAAR